MSAGEGLLILLNFAFPFALLVVAFFVGRMLESSHLADLDAREKSTSPTVAVTVPTARIDAREGVLVTGSVVVSLDYWKRIAAFFRVLIGGNVKAFEPLLVRARREAVLRMKEDAIAQGYAAVVNVRLETARLASNRSDGKGTAGIEILAFGTAVK